MRMKKYPFPQIYIIFIDPLLNQMIKIKNRSLSQIPRPHTTSACIRNSQGIERQFIPFHQERDQIGRLLKSAKNNQNNNVVYDYTSTQIFEVPKKSEKKLEDKINKYFQMSRLPIPSYQFQKSKILKKAKISIPINQNFHKKILKKASIDEKIPILNEKQMILAKQFSKINWQSSQKSYVGIKRMKSSIIPRGNIIFSPPKNAISSKQISSSTASLPKKNDLNLQKFAQLNRYHRWQELQVKTYSNFEQGHTKFLEKIIESKKLAFDVKINLDKIDALC